jgi:hypothetical protein
MLAGPFKQTGVGGGGVSPWKCFYFLSSAGVIDISLDATSVYREIG